MKEITSLSNLHKWPLKELLENKLTDYYMLDGKTPFFFRINDSKELVQYVQKNVRQDQIVQEFFSQRIGELDKLKESLIWMRLEDESIIKMNLLDVYETFIKSLKDDTYEDYLFNAYEISFIGVHGPFKSMSFINILNEELIQKMIFHSVIKSKLPTRKFRIHTKGRVLFRFGENFKHEDFFDVKQISNTGILFSSQNSELLQTMSTGQRLKVYITSEKIKNFTLNNLKSNESFDKDLFYTEDELRGFEVLESKTTKSLSHRSGESNEFFLFVRFTDMEQSEIPDVFKSFLEKAQQHLKKFVA